MSTPGKVLVVLVLLLAPVWVIMVSSVAQLNKNGGEQVANLKKQVETLENEVAATRKQIVDLKDKIELEQVTMAEHLAAIRAHKADLEKARSETREIASRVSFQVTSLQEQVKDAATRRDHRIAEKNAEREAVQAAEAEVKKLQQEHAQLTERLDKLRNEFKTTVDTNRQLLDSLKPSKSS